MSGKNCCCRKPENMKSKPEKGHVCTCNHSQEDKA